SVEGDGAAAAGDASSQPPPPRTPSENGSGGEPEPLPGRASVGSRDAQVEAAILAQPQGIAVRELPGAVGCTRAALQGPLPRQLAHDEREARAVPVPVPETDKAGSLQGRILSALTVNAMTPHELASYLETPIEHVARETMALLDEGELRKIPDTRPARLERVL